MEKLIEGKVARRGSKFPTLADMIVLVLIFVLSSLGGLLVARVCGCEFISSESVVSPEEWGFTVFVNYLGQMVLMLIMVVAYRKLRKAQPIKIGVSLKGLNPLVLLWAMVTMLSISIVLSPLLEIVGEDFGQTPDVGRGVWALLSTVVLAPLFEELLCRGFVLESLKARYGVIMAWLASSIFFAVIHLHPVMVINALVLGMLLGYIYLRGESLLGPLLLHAFNNLLALVMMWTSMPDDILQGKSLAEVSLSELIPSTAGYLVVYVVALIIVVSSSLYVWRDLARIRREQRKKCAGKVINSEQDALNSDKKD